MERFCCKTTVITGENALSVLRELKAERVLVVTDPYFSANGTAQRIGTMVPKACVKLFDQVRPDPSVELVAQGAAVCLAFRPQLMIALGGGSAMDCAKAMAAALDFPMTFAAIPTTSGSGSEVTGFSVLTSGTAKLPLIDPELYPDLAILDDSLLQQLPAALAADTGMDLIAHCMEALASKNSSVITGALAQTALSVALQELEASFAGKTDGRRALHEAACMAGIAFDNAGLGLCHAMAHALGAVVHLPHGRLCAMLLPPVMEWNAPAACEAYRKAALACGLPAPTGRLAARSLSAAIVRLRKQLRMPADLREAGVDTDLLRFHRQQIVETAMADPCCSTNPIPVTAQMAANLLQAVEG